MPEKPSEHVSADRGMRWLRNNWYVPIVVAIDMAIIWRPHAADHQTVPDSPAVTDSPTPEILQKELAGRPREESAKPPGKQLPSPSEIGRDSGPLPSPERNGGQERGR